jgi:hypothetical protein
MFRSRFGSHQAQAAAIDLRWLPMLCRQLLIGTVAVMLVLGIHSVKVAHAEEYVFSIGMLVKFDQRTITLGFEDGTTETYRIGPQTTIRSQNGDERSLAAFELGSPVLIITPPGDSTAYTIVDGGPNGFHEAGPADIRGHEGACLCGDDSAEPSHT